MQLHLTAPLIAALLAVCTTTTTGQAQGSKKATARAAAAAPAETPETITTADSPPAGDSSGIAAHDTVHKKRGGLMGKVKSVAKNKLVQQVAKVAACTVVPGGQFVAGAIDAASSKSAAGAAQGAAGAATGTSCMPGMGGTAGMAGGGMAGAGAASMGLSAAQLAAMQAGRGGAGGAGTVDQQAMMAAQMQQMQAMMSPQMSAAGAAMTEAPGRTVELSPDLAADLAKGKTIVRSIDWIGGMPGVSPAGTPGFTQAMAQLAGAMAQTGGSYRLDLYLDRRYEDVIVKSLGAQRLATVEAALSDGLHGAPSAAVVELGKTKKDKDPRLEIVKRK